MYTIKTKLIDMDTRMNFLHAVERFVGLMRHSIDIKKVIYFCSLAVFNLILSACAISLFGAPDVHDKD